MAHHQNFLIKPLAITLMGPTAAGKTDLAIALREKLNADIISVDSAMVYRGLDIGSAKPKPEELTRAPHRLIDIRDPHEPYSAADFCRDATREIIDIQSQGKTPLLVGGTMMYFKALLEGLSDMPPANALVREEIERDARVHGWPKLHAELTAVDPDSAAAIHPNHSQRLSRALEVYRVTGKPMSSFRGKPSGGLRRAFNWVEIAIAPRERQVLHQRIEERFDLMLEQGFIEEVQQLSTDALANNLVLDQRLPAMRAVGYRQAWDYINGLCDEAEFRLRGIAATRQLAKRQLTWLRGWKTLNWLYTQDEKGDSYSFSELIAYALKIIGERAI